jgi:hypothetical protein
MTLKQNVVLSVVVVDMWRVKMNSLKYFQRLYEDHKISLETYMELLKEEWLDVDLYLKRINQELGICKARLKKESSRDK